VPDVLQRMAGRPHDLCRLRKMLSAPLEWASDGHRRTSRTLSFKAPESPWPGGLPLPSVTGDPATFDRDTIRRFGPPAYYSAATGTARPWSRKLLVWRERRPSAPRSSATQ